MRNRRLPALFATLLVIGACDGGPVTPVSPDSSSQILDGGTGGNTHFYFLPPMVPSRTFAGTFDASLSPVIKITASGEPTITLTPTVSTLDQSYQANWDTKTTVLNPSKIYRITVSVDALELGFADVVVGANQKALKNVDTGEFVPLMDGRTLPIKFRVEEGFNPFSPTISAGREFTCATDASGHAYCWGRNDSGELGDESFTERLSPTPVSSSLVFAKLEAAWGYVCGLTDQGQEYCWGSNSYGQLGDGTTSDHQLPALVSGGLTFKQITASPYHACGLTPTGQAYCWGSNAFGKLGDGVFGAPTPNPTPIPVLGGITFTQIAGGYDATCGLTVSGAAYCWGSNRYGQLGDGTLSDRATPTLVLGGLAFASLTMGDGHTCGLTPSGQAYCWGVNGRGMLGDGTLTWTTSPVAVAGGLVFKQLSAEYDQTCGLTTGGQAYCWGYNASGQLGNGSTTWPVNSPTAVAGSLTFTKIALGDNHTCGLTAGGLRYCWGNNDHGQIGDGTTSINRLTPTAVLPF